MLRGAFGHALRKAVCAMGPEQPCETCTLRGPCLYTRLFETFVDGEPPPFLQGLATSPRPYVVEPGTEARGFAPGDPLETDLLLLGQAVGLQAYALQALEHMGEGGFGQGRAPFTLERVRHLDEGGSWQTGFEAASGGGSRRWPNGAEGVPAILPPAPPDPAPERLTLRFATPTRIRVQGRLSRGLSFRQLAFPMLRRVLELAHFHVPPRLRAHRGRRHRAARRPQRLLHRRASPPPPGRLHRRRHRPGDRRHPGRGRHAAHTLVLFGRALQRRLERAMATTLATA